MVVGVKPELRDRYLKLHSAVWPEVEAALRACNVTNYSIFIFGDVLFAYYEYVGLDHDADMARIGEDARTREWWTLTDPCQVPLGEAPDGRSPWKQLDEVWHLS